MTNPKVYKNVAVNFSSFDHFKEVATKTLAEIFGREKPIDVVDFSYDDEGNYTAVGYYEGEEVPDYVEPGTLIEGVEGQVGLLTEEDKANGERIKTFIREGRKLSDADMELIPKLGIVFLGEIEEEARPRVLAIIDFFGADAIVEADGSQPGEIITFVLSRQGEIITQGTLAELEERIKTEEKPVYTLKEILKASDAAIALAEEKGIDLKLVTGTGADGNITKTDVANYLKNQPAPAQENANGTGEQSNT